MRGDGDGWVVGPEGSRHWGTHGAAGLLLRAPLSDGKPAVLLQHRALWSHQGGTWALPGGARDSHESTVHAAIREAEEEAGIKQQQMKIRAQRITADALSGWSYTTVIADALTLLPTVANAESTELRWVSEKEVDTLPLHPGFAESWPLLRTQEFQVHMGTAHSAMADIWKAALPRTVELPDGGFGWCTSVHTNNFHDGDTVLIMSSGVEPLQFTVTVACAHSWFS
ncbi:MAG: NUDIX hydrolase [Mycobacteriaceae bacterium]